MAITQPGDHQSAEVTAEDAPSRSLAAHARFMTTLMGDECCGIVKVCGYVTMVTACRFASGSFRACDSICRSCRAGFRCHSRQPPQFVC
jgi:hypothetical protein